MKRAKEATLEQDVTNGNELQDDVTLVAEAEDKDNKKTTRLTITPPNFKVVELPIIYTAPFVQLRFSEKQQNKMEAKMILGEAGKKNKKREPRKFETEFEEALYKLPDGGRGIPAASFRNAAIATCRMAGFEMVKAKMSIFVEADGYDVIDGTPLVRLTGTPKSVKHIVRNQTGVADIRTRGMWDEWTCKIRVRYDADQFTLTDVINLFLRAGIQCGVGEGRPFSKKSCGMGWGTFTVKTNVQNVGEAA